jgi:hypothetical protein
MRKLMRKLRGLWIAAICVGLTALTLLVIACGAGSIVLSDVFPDAEALPDWTPLGDVEIYDRDTLFDLVNGQAESFFAYNFEQVAVRRYESTSGEQMRMEIWQLATPEDAYGLFTISIAGDPLEGFGNDGDIEPGLRMAFWQDRYFVHVRAREQLYTCDPHILAEAVTAALPSGGERPDLLTRLPAEGLVERSPVFFHEEISIQDWIWLGGENLLGLSLQTDGILARYDLAGSVGQLLLIQYPDAQGAKAGLEALQGSAVEQLVIAEAQDELLVAVLGPVNESTAWILLNYALLKE